MAKSEVLYLIEVEDPKKVIDSRDGTGFLDLKFLQVKGCGETLKHLLGKGNWMGTGESNSFGKLSVLGIDNCGVQYLFSPSVASALGQLQELTVRGCDAMEVIVGGVEDEQVAFENNIIIFPRLKKIKLTSLSKLKTIYSGSTSSPTPQALFTEMVSFPALKDLHIYGLSSIKVIWDCQLLSIESFENLVSLKIYSCDSMLSLIDFEILETLVFPKLKTMELQYLEKIKGFCNGYRSANALFNHKVSFPALETLDIKELKSITTIWKWDNLMNQSLPIPNKTKDSLFQLSKLVVEKCDNLVNLGPLNVVKRLSNLVELKIVSCNSMIYIAEGGAEVDDVIVEFPQLKTMTLNILPHFKSFWCICESNESVQELPTALFNNKVTFPTLESLEIRSLGKVTTICDNHNQSLHIPNDSLLLLSKLVVENCENLVNVGPFNVVQRLRNLVEFNIISCTSIISIVEAQSGAKGDDDEILMFPNLKAITLRDLQSFNGFWNSREFDQGAEELPLTLFNIKVSHPALVYLDICGLKNIKAIWDSQLFSMENFGNLGRLHVKSCDSMVYVVNFSKGCEMETLVFPKLTTMKLHRLKELKGFCYGYGSAKVLFNQKVRLPCLECLSVKGIDNLEGIWESIVWTDSFCKLKELKVGLCDRLLRIAPSKLLQNFQDVEELLIFNCESLKEVFKVEASKETKEIISFKAENNTFFPKLHSLEFERLPNLMHLHPKICISELRLSEISLIDCPKFEKGFSVDIIDDEASE